MAQNIYKSLPHQPTSRWAVRFVLAVYLLSPLNSHLSTLHAQSQTDWRDVYERIYEAYEDENEVIDEEELEKLDEIAANPFNINTITQEQLEEFPFLSDDEINAIAYYIYRYKGMITLNELQSIPQLSAEKQQLLRFFLYCGEDNRKTKLSLKNMLKYGNHELYYGGRIPLYERKGDVVKPEDGGYLGIPYKQIFRYTYNYSNRVKVGLVGANNSGEPFFAGRNGKGFDFYSFYAQLKDVKLTDTWRLSNIVLGRYRAAFGMGLTLNNGFSLGKSTMMSSAGRIATGFRPHSSSSDGKYFQGLALSLTNTDGTITASLFASSRNIHATVNDKAISTIVNSGYHRTTKEMEKKNAATQNAIGANLSYRHKRAEVGLTAIYSHLNLPLLPDKTKPFRRYYTEGKDFLTAGLNYSYKLNRLAFKGELSTSPAAQADSFSSGLALSTINMLTFRPRYGLTFSLLHRYYSQKYTTLFGKCFAENAAMQDEHGVFGGVEWPVSRTVSLQYNIDYAHFHNPKYLVSTSSNMLENSLYLSWHKKEWTLSIRGKLKNRQYDSSDKKFLVWKNKASLRAQGEYTADEKDKQMKGLHGKIAFQYAFYNKDTDYSNGYLALLNGGFSPLQWLTADLSAAYFNTDDYYSAIYAYERGLSYGMNYIQMYGEGMRLSLMLKVSLTKKLSATAKIGSTKYFDRKTIGTGMEELKTSIKTDIDFQLHWKF